MKKLLFLVVLMVGMISVHVVHGQSVTIISNPDPPTICAGQSITLQANPIGGIATSYFWTPGGACTQSITVVPLVTTTYMVTVTFVGGCTVSAYSIVAVFPIPFSVGPITGPTTVCQNSTVCFSINAVPYATSYVWSVPPGATIISGQWTTVITVDFAGPCLGTISVYGQNSCGVGQSSFLPVTVNQAPSLTVTATATEICAGTTTTICANGYPPGTTFLWSTGATSPSICVSPLVTTVYSVIATGTSACTTTGSITIFVHNLTVSLVLTPDNFCTDVNSALLSGGSGSPPGGTGTYSGACVFYGTTVYPPVSGVGTYLVTYTYTDGFGCSGSATDLLTINPIPPVMFLNITTGVYTDTPAFCLEPYVRPTGGMFIGPGIIGDYFDPAIAGPGTWMITYTYTHPITGCSATQIQYIPVASALGVNTLSQDAFSIFPNPTIDYVNIRGIDTKDIKSIRVMNVLGELLYDTETIGDSIQLDVSAYPSGMYIIFFTSTEGISFGKHFMKK